MPTQPLGAEGMASGLDPSRERRLGTASGLAVAAVAGALCWALVIGFAFAQRA